MSYEKYPIIKVDRTTIKEILPLLMQRGLFSDYKALPTKEELLENAKLQSGTESLTKEKEREVLSLAKKYRTKNYIHHDYGKYVIGFSLGFLANDTDEALSQALGRISLYKLGHKLAMIIFSEVYEQRKSVNIVITKERILELLGYTSYEKQIYKQIDDVMFSLMTLNYYIHEYKTKSFTQLKSRQLGYFVYDVKADAKSYTLSVNPNYVGCITDVFNNDPDAVRNLKRGYVGYPTSLIPASKNFTTAAYMLSTFLIAESGNATLNYRDNKVIAYSVKNLLEVMKIESGRFSEAKRQLISALTEVKIINKTSPSIKELSAMKPALFMQQTIHIELPKDVEKLDSIIKSNLLPAKGG
jgi:hypothetical protein